MEKHLCECGKEFATLQSLRAHLPMCRKHYEKIGKDFDAMLEKRSKALSESIKRYHNVKKSDYINKWGNEKHTCERCGKVMTELYGSGRFCSSNCSHSRPQSIDTRVKISNALADNPKSVDEFINSKSIDNSEKSFQCDVCGKWFTKRGYSAHYNTCRKKHHLTVLANLNGVMLNIITNELDDYLSTHQKCEICGKSIDEAVRWENKSAPKRLCIDHDHTTGRFRGVLCQVCNRQLGWYEKHKDSITKYLHKDDE